MSNHLQNETSPYLLQHLDNPVDWFPWGEEALQMARDQHKPILLSIGYAACHWCHVMAHESFEDEATAKLMNQWFVNIKVDREERPDLDSIYMAAVTSMTGHGGWPMTVFLTPEGKPFFSGTYYPPQPRYGMPSFSQVLTGIADAWQNRQEDVLGSAEKVTAHLRDSLAIAEADQSGAGRLQVGVLEKALAELSSRYDRQWGGFGSAPKFPQPTVLEFLLRDTRRSPDPLVLNMVCTTLHKMAQGGIYDHLGGGFARYSTDDRWLVPHFEKMLYDNAQLARVYLYAWQLTGEQSFRCVVEETLDYVLREMTHPDGGFYSSQDADSEGVEGKFFVWSAEEISKVLGEDAGLFMQVYDVSESGNWEGENILHLSASFKELSENLDMPEEALRSSLERSRNKLLSVRAERVWPGLDDKVLTAWNGLMISAFAEAGRILERADYIAAASRNAKFLRSEMRGENGRLLRTWKAGSGARYNAYLEDYACLAEGLLSLYEADFQTSWFTWARELTQYIQNHFKDPNGPGFYDTSDDHEQLIHRPKDLQDNAMPSGNARTARVLFRLGLYTGDTELLQAAEESVVSVAQMMAKYPGGFGEWLNVASFMLSEPRELAIVGEPDTMLEMRSVLRQSYLPNLVVAAGMDDANNPVPLLAGRTMLNGLPTAYLCRGFSCQTPVSSAEDLRRMLNDD